MIEFSCPHCGNSMKVNEAAAGKKGNCKKCGKPVRVPDNKITPSAPEAIVIDAITDESVLTTRRSKHVRIPLSLVNSSIVVLILLAVVVFMYFYMTPKTKESIIAEVEPSVAAIKGRHGTGSGFLIDNNFLATNKHVISKELMRNIEVRFPSAPSGQKGPYESELIYEDDELDIAILKVKTELSPLSSLKNYTFKRGQEVSVIGNPGLGTGTTLENAISSGVMSSQATLEGVKYDQLSISINPGNSGGPVLDDSGSVIGIVTLKAAKREGLGFSIPISELSTRVSRSKGLSDAEIKKNQDTHKARVLSWYATMIGELFLEGMRRYSNSMHDSIQAGKSANEGIEKIRSKLISDLNLSNIKIDEIVSIINDEIANSASSKHITETAKQRLIDLWTNSLESKSYYDNPRGSYTTYNSKYDELLSNHERLSVSLKLMLGIKDKKY